jgi:hypothetical protein
MPLDPKSSRSAWSTYSASDASVTYPAVKPVLRAGAQRRGPSLHPRERRDDERVPLHLFLDEYVDDRPHRALASNVSPMGLYLHRALSGRRLPSVHRQNRYVQLEFALPGTGDTIWARGEICYDDLGMDLVHGTGIHLTDLARGHRRLLRDFVYERKRQRLHELLQLIRRNRYH